MDLKSAALLTITLVASAATVSGDQVPRNGPKYVPVFVSAEALNSLNEKDGQINPPAPVESGQDKNDYDIKKEIQNILYGPPAPVYEHQPDHQEPNYSPPISQNNQPQFPNIQQTAPLQPAYPNEFIQSQQPDHQEPSYSPPPISQNNQPQYPNIQQTAPLQPAYPNQLIQSQQPDHQEPSYSPPPISQKNQPQYPNIQQTAPLQQTFPNQLIQTQQSYQQPNQQYQMSQAQSQSLSEQQPGPQQTGPQPIYDSQQQMLQPGSNQQPLLTQQLVAQPIQTYQQQNQLLMSQPAANQQTLTQSNQPLLNQQAMPNQEILWQQQIQNAQLPSQQPIMQQPSQNGPNSNIIPINFAQPNQGNPGYIQNPNQNLYAVVPIGGNNLGSNQNVGSNTYLVPVQQVPNQFFAVNSG